ncbi:hypothetical protein CVT26_004540 [Gymnopilus dilepis]|uniref:Uncharacterized protein n=1 Tax=Gymnopilus dilepis TaxID=231916 RepID=A0A409YIZ2_9AGAR|nr:hypothetical protein CVT26_004540 [Gymnopilus dilepis]
MSYINEIPPEILATVFEISIYTSGISALRPLSVVCQHWHDIVEQTPRLWGIILLHKHSSPEALQRQITKAKAAPLSITIDPGTRSLKRTANVFQQLSALSRNWVMATVGTDFISSSRWVNLHRSLEELALRRANPAHNEPSLFFDGVDALSKRETRLRSFTATGLPKAWIVGFLGPSILQFRLVNGFCDFVDQSTWSSRPYSRISDTWDYLSRIPNVVNVHLKHLRHNDPRGSALSPVRLSKLENLHVEDVLRVPILLSSIAAPSLQTLVIDRRRTRKDPWGFVFPEYAPMAPFFARWSEPAFLPSNLHTLQLWDCLEVADVPYVIRWLGRLPNLVRLIIGDESNVLRDAPSRLSLDEGENNLYKALAAPISRGDGSLFWLCPSLMILHLEADHHITDLLPIASARGGITPTPHHGIPPPNRLRRIEALLCNTGEKEQIDLLSSLVDQAYCICTTCGLHGMSF